MNGGWRYAVSLAGGWSLEAHVDGVSGAYINQLQILVVNLLRADDMRCNGKHNFILSTVFRILSKEVLEDRNLREPRITAQRAGFRVLQNSADQIRLAIF